MLIFAVVYAILSLLPVFRDKDGKPVNRGAMVIIAISIGILALWSGYVSEFFQSIFPKFGIGVSILLVGLILAGAFISSENAFKWIFFGIGMLIFIVVAASSLGSMEFPGNWQWNSWWQSYGGLIVVALIVAAAIVAIVLAGREKKP